MSNNGKYTANVIQRQRRRTATTLMTIGWRSKDNGISALPSFSVSVLSNFRRQFDAELKFGPNSGTGHAKMGLCLSFEKPLLFRIEHQPAICLSGCALGRRLVSDVVRASGILVFFPVVFQAKTRNRLWKFLITEIRWPERRSAVAR